MTIMKPSDSLDTWRDYFGRGDSDIFGIIEHAIMVAAADSPKEFKSRRDTIAELLFSCQVSPRSTEFDHLHLSKAGDKEANTGRKAVETDDGGHEEDEEMELNNSQIVDEVMRIKAILLNKHDETNAVLLESLTKLASMSISVDLLKDTEIGKAVIRLRRHGSDKISKLAKTLFAEWKEKVDQWMNMPKEVAGTDGTPESTTLSIVDEAYAFPSPPHDLDFYAAGPNGFDFSQILDSLDCDGNLLDSVEPKHERKVKSSVMRRPEGTNEGNVVKWYNKDQHVRREEVDVRPMRRSTAVFDEPRRQPKQNKREMVRVIQRKPVVVAEQKRKLDGCQQDKTKALDPEAKFENAKRRLHESYQQHEKDKKRRKIQVLETIPKQSKTKKPLLRRPVRR